MAIPCLPLSELEIKTHLSETFHFVFILMRGSPLILYPGLTLLGDGRGRSGAILGVSDPHPV